MKKSKKKAAGDFMVLSLCAACVRQFYDSPDHIVRRVNPNEKYKESCNYCSCKNGWTYKIQRRVK